MVYIRGEAQDYDDWDEALGGAWDRELETYRHASDASPVIWLHRVG